MTENSLAVNKLVTKYNRLKLKEPDGKSCLTDDEVEK